MNSKEHLEQIKKQDDRVNRMRTQLLSQKDALQSMGIKFESIGAKPSTPRTDSLGVAIAKFVDYEDELREAQAKLVLMRFEAAKAIQNLEDENEREVLERIYLRYQSIDHVKEKMGYSRRRIYDFRRAGLDKIHLPES